MEEESEVSAAIRFLVDHVADTPKSKIKTQIRECCDLIQAGSLTGLEKKDIGKLAKGVIFVDGYDLHTKRRLLYSIMPITADFPYEIIPLAISSAKLVNQKPSWSTNVLNWLGSLLEHRIIDSNHRLLHICYTPIFYMIGQISTCAHAVKVLYFITQVDDITSWRVQHLVKLSKKIGIKDYVSHLQGLYRIYRPDLIAYEVRSRRNLPKGSNILFEVAKAARSRLDEQEPVEYGGDRAWPEIDLATKLNPLKRPTAVPHPEIDLYAERLEERKKEHIFTTHYKTIQDYIDNIKCWEKWRWPNNSSSHLSYPTIIPLFRPHHAHVCIEIINWLQYALKYEVIDPVGDISHSRSKKLLSCTISLVRHTQSTNPAVFRFLNDFLALWDGSSYTNQILELLSWMPYTSSFDFFESVMRVLSGIMVKAELNHWCAIINALGNMILTWAIQAHNEAHNGIHKDWFFGDYIFGPLEGLWFLTSQLERYFLTALQEYKFHSRVVNKILDYYVKLDMIVTKLEFPIFFFPPTPFTLAILVRGDLVATHRIAQLLINMKHQLQRVNELETKGAQTFFKNECLDGVEDINESIKLLMSGTLSKAFNKEWISSFRQFLHDEVVSDLVKMPGIKRSLSIVRMLTYLPCVAEAFANDEYEIEDKGKRKELQKSVFTYLENLNLSGIKTFLNSYNPESSSSSPSVSSHEDS